MSKTIYKGVIPPAIIPLTQDRKFDVPAFERNINRMIDAGVDGIFILGSSGEVAFSTDQRRDYVIREAVRIIDHRVPLFCGIIDIETERVIQQGMRVQEMGVDVLVATAPFYALGGPAEVEQHFRLVKDALELPLFAYDIPPCVHTKLDWRMLVKLGQDGVLDGVKDSSGDDVSFRYLCIANEDAGHPLTVLTGHEVAVDGAYLAGADGSVPGLANVEPYGYVRMWKAAQAGDWETARKEQDKLARLMHITDVTKNVQGFAAGIGAFKTAMMLLGYIDSNQMPHPTRSLKGENVEAIRQVLVENGLL